MLSPQGLDHYAQQASKEEVAAAEAALSPATVLELHRAVEPL
jgi:hypothetical protein